MFNTMFHVKHCRYFLTSYSSYTVLRNVSRETLLFGLRSCVKYRILSIICIVRIEYYILSINSLATAAYSREPFP